MVVIIGGSEVVSARLRPAFLFCNPLVPSGVIPTRDTTKGLDKTITFRIRNAQKLSNIHSLRQKRGGGRCMSVYHLSNNGAKAPPTPSPLMRMLGSKFNAGPQHWHSSFPFVPTTVLLEYSPSSRKQVFAAGDELDQNSKRFPGISSDILPFCRLV